MWNTAACISALLLVLFTITHARVITWNSNTVLYNDFIVETGSTLVINPGVSVSTNASIIVYGKLQAVGHVGNLITIHGVGMDSSLTISGGGERHLLQYVNLKLAVSITNVDVSLAYCNFLVAAQITDSVVEIDSSHFQPNTYVPAVVNSVDSNLTISNSVVNPYGAMDSVIQFNCALGCSLVVKGSTINVPINAGTNGVIGYMTLENNILSVAQSAYSISAQYVWKIAMLNNTITNPQVIRASYIISECTIHDNSAKALYGITNGYQFNCGNTYLKGNNIPAHMVVTAIGDCLIEDNQLVSVDGSQSTCTFYNNTFNGFGFFSAITSRTVVASGNTFSNGANVLSSFVSLLFENNTVHNVAVLFDVESLGTQAIIQNNLFVNNTCNFRRIPEVPLITINERMPTWITNNTFLHNRCAVGVLAIRTATTVVVQHNLFISNEPNNFFVLEVSATGSGQLNITNNAFIGYQHSLIQFLACAHNMKVINAQYNYWGVTNDDVLRKKLGIPGAVIYLPYLLTPNINDLRSQNLKSFRDYNTARIVMLSIAGSSTTLLLLLSATYILLVALKHSR